MKNYLKPMKGKKSLLMLVAFGLLWGSNAMAADKSIDSVDQLCSETMRTCLKDVKSAELHFFWTTGCTLSDSEAWGAVRDVAIGGKRYKDTFYSNLGVLLKNAPSHLKVKLVYDAPTKESNKKAFDSFYNQYPDCFEALSIEDVQGRLLKTFPDHQEQVNKVFQNATGGNPAIASDIYRLIAMPYGHDSSPEAMTETQYAYCDVDTFSESLSRIYGGNRDYSIFYALFQKPATSIESFYLGRGKNNNDLIKISINSVDAYKAFCVSVLEGVVKTSHSDLLNMFNDLHQSIKEFERQDSEELDYPRLTSSKIINIMYATGPGFLDYYCQSTDCIGPYGSMGSTLEWHGGTQLLAKKGGVYIFSDIPIPSSGGTIDEETYKAQESAFEDYENIVATALYARRFGEHHPFNIKIRDELKEKFPYLQAFYKNLDEILNDSPTGHFKDFIKEAYDYQKAEGMIKETDDEWLAKIFKWITILTDGRKEMPLDNYDPYYVRLTYLLKQVGVEVPFTVKDIDFRISKSEAEA